VDPDDRSLVMTLPLSAAEVLGEHVAFELECIDRIYCNAYVPKLAYAGGVASFFTKHRGATFASTCLADPISKAFVAAIHRYAGGRHAFCVSAMVSVTVTPTSVNG
jgi:hypothetical protein